MDKQYFNPDKDGFYGVYYPNKEKSGHVMIAMLDDSSDDRMDLDHKLKNAIRNWII